MKTKKELLKSFLEGLGLWEMFSAEVAKLHAYEGAPSWDCVDNNLDFLFNAVAGIDADCKDIRVANRLKDNTYLEQLINNEDVGSYTVAFAVIDLCEFAGLDERAGKQVLKRLPDETSVKEIVDMIYDAAKAHQA